VFSRDMQDWLAAIFGLGVTLEPEMPGPSTETYVDAGQAWLSQSLAEGREMTPALVSRRGAAADSGLVLVLPADAVPSMQALVSRHLATGDGDLAGPFLVADRADRRARWSVGLPSAGLPFLAGLQPTAAALPCPVLRPVLSPVRRGGGLQPGPAASLAPLLLAIAYRDPPTANEAELMVPVATDSGRPLLRAMAAGPAALPLLSILLVARDLQRARATLSSLARQDGLGICEVQIVAAAPEAADPAALARIASEILPRAEVRVVPAGAASRLPDSAATARHDLLLHLTDTTLLHDPRCLSVLCAMLAADAQIASASCLLLREIDYKGTSRLQPAAGGLFPAQISLLAAPRLTFAAPDCLGPLPLATWPVVANLLDLALIRTSALHRARARLAGLRAGDPVTDLAFGLAALAEGGCHLCTSAVRATTLAAATPGRDDMDPVALAHVEPARWDEILGRVTLLRDLG